VNALASVPISEMTAAVDSGPIPGMVVNRSRAAPKSAVIASIYASRPWESHRLQVVDVV
jgi:hypothetical protein